MALLARPKGATKPSSTKLRVVFCQHGQFAQCPEGASTVEVHDVQQMVVQTVPSAPGHWPLYYVSGKDGKVWRPLGYWFEQDS